MSTEIEQRVVEMQFDNKQFERDVSTTMSSLGKLRQSLNLSGAAKGLESVGTAARGINLSGLSGAAETVSLKFNAMYSAVDQIFRNLVTRAQYAGERIASALTIDPIKTGFSEYETQINAVQTILANTKSKGTGIDDVNGALDELNTYADKTIYNFTEMTRNIGTFTAAGVDLDKSVTSIKGIANLAAVSGSTSQQASTAMYQLSQALAAGKVQLMDWNSVVNAGMGGEVFQEALKRTAKNMGTDVDAMIKKYGSFRESLTRGEWLTADVLTETLTQLSGAYTEADLIAKGYTKEQAADILDLANTAEEAATKVKTFTQLWDTLKESAQSGWTQTWELLVGDFEEAKETLTTVSEVLGEIIGNSAKKRNDLLSGALDTNWEKMIKNINEAGIATGTFEDKLKSAMEAQGLDVAALIKEHGSLEEAFRSGAVSSDILKEALSGLSGAMVDLSSIERTLKKGNKGDDVKLAQEALQNLGHDLGKTGIDGSFGPKTEAAVKAFQELKGLEVTGIIDEKTLDALEEANKSTTNLLETCKGLADAITDLGGREKIIEGIKNIFNGLMNVLKPIGDAFRDIFPATTVGQVVKFIDRFRALTKVFEEFTANHYYEIHSTFKGIFSVLDIGWTIIKDLAGGVVKLLGHFSGLGGGILDITSKLGGWLVSLRDTVKQTDIFGTAVDKVVGFAAKVINELKKFATMSTTAFDGSKLEGFFQFLHGIWNVIKQIGLKVGEMFAPLFEAVANLFQNGSFSDILNDGIFAAVLVGIYKFVDNLNGPLGSLKDLFDGISGEDGLLGGLKETLDSVRGCFEAYQNSLKADILKKIAVAIAILAGSLFVLSSIDGEALDRSLGAITILFADLMASLAIFTKMDLGNKALIKGVTAITGLAAALLILSGAMKIMSTMSWEELGIGIAGTVAGLGALVTAVNWLPENNVIKASKAIGKLATALVILAAGMKIMASMSWQEMGVAITGVVVGLGALVAAVNLLPEDAARRSRGMIGLATSMVILGGALKILGSLSWDELKTGLGAMAGSLAALTIAMKFMPADMAAKGFGMIALATAIAILGAALKSMGGMSIAEINSALTAMGGALIELSIALNLMNGTLAGSAALLVAAGAIAILAPVLKTLGKMSLKSIGKGLLALAGAFAVIGVAGLLLGPLVPTLLGLAGAMALFGLATLGIGVGITALATGFTALAAAGTAGATALVAAIAAIVVGVIDLIPTIAESLGDAVVTLCDVFIECAPKIAETLLVVVAEVMAALAEYTPQIVDSLMQFLIGVMDALAANMPQLITSAMNLIGSFFKGIVDALSGIDTTALLEMIAGVGLMTGLMYALSGLSAMIPSAMAGVLGMGALIAELSLVIAALGAFAQIPGIEWLISEGGDFLQVIGTAIGQFVGGIVGGIAEGATSTLPQIGTNLSDFITNLQPFIEGMAGVDPSVIDSTASLAGAILALTAANVLDGIARFFGFGDSLSGFGEQLVPFGTAMKDYAAAVADLNTESINASVEAAKGLVAVADAIPSDGLFELDGIDDFGKNLVTFGKSMKEYSDVVQGIDTEAITTSVTAAEGLVAIGNAVPDDGWTGTDGIDDFGSNLEDFGESIKAYAEEVAGVNYEGTNNSVAMLKTLMSTINSMAGIDTSGIEVFEGALSDLASLDVKSVVDTLSTDASQLESVGKDMFNAIVEGAKSTKSNFVEAAGIVIDSAIEAVTFKTVHFKIAGIETISTFINGVLSGKARVSRAFGSALSTAITTIKGYYKNFYSAAAYLVTGFANGISANKYKAAAQARAMAAAAANAAREELDEHSPSKVGYGIGDFFGIGFVNAIADNVKNAYNTSVGLANAAESGLKSAFDRVSRIINGEVEISPTVTPVIDLTNVRSGVNAINGMFGLQPSMGVLAHVGAVSSMMNQRSQNGGADKVVSAIGRLEKALGNVGGTTNIINGLNYTDTDGKFNEALGIVVRALLMGGRV